MYRMSTDKHGSMLSGEVIASKIHLLEPSLFDEILHAILKSGFKRNKSEPDHVYIGRWFEESE